METHPKSTDLIGHWEASLTFYNYKQNYHITPQVTAHVCDLYFLEKTRWYWCLYNYVKWPNGCYIGRFIITITRLHQHQLSFKYVPIWAYPQEFLLSADKNHFVKWLNKLHYEDLVSHKIIVMQLFLLLHPTLDEWPIFERLSMNMVSSWMLSVYTFTPPFGPHHFVGHSSDSLSRAKHGSDHNFKKLIKRNCITSSYGSFLMNHSTACMDPSM